MKNIKTFEGFFSDLFGKAEEKPAHHHRHHSTKQRAHGIEVDKIYTTPNQSGDWFKNFTDPETGEEIMIVTKSYANQNGLNTQGEHPDY